MARRLRSSAASSSSLRARPAAEHEVDQAQARSAGGGALGSALSSGLSDLMSPPGAFVVLVGLLIGGLILMLNVTLRGLLTPVAGGGKKLAGVIAVPARALAVGAADAAKT